MRSFAFWKGIFRSSGSAVALAGFVFLASGCEIISPDLSKNPPPKGLPINLVSLTGGLPLLNSVTSQVFPSTYVTQGQLVSIDWNDMEYGVGYPTDSNMTYSCVYDQVYDGVVMPGTPCMFLPGTATFNTITGVLNWQTDYRTWGVFELKVTGTNLIGSATQTIVIDVREPYTQAGLNADYNAMFGNLWGFPNNPYGVWKELFGGVFDAPLIGGAITTTGWQGAGTAASPNRLVFTGADRVSLPGGVLPGAQTQLMVSSWVAPSSVATANTVVVGNGGGSGKGFVVRQSSFFPGKLEFDVGIRDYATEVLADTPIGYWRLGEGAGPTATDSSGGGRNGTYVGGITYVVAGAINLDSNNAARFDGLAGTSVQVPDSLPLRLNTYTVEVWVRPALSTLNTNNVILAKDFGYNYLLYFSASNKPEIYNQGLTPTHLDGTVSIPKNAWSHVVATYDGTNRCLYINGVMNVCDAPTGTPTTGTQPLEFGGSNGGLWNFPGDLDEIAVYNYALSASRIAQHYSYAIYSQAVLGSNPMGYWRLGEAASPSTDSTAGLFGNAVDNGTVIRLSGSAIVGDADQSVNLGGTGYLAITANTIPNTVGASFEAWVKTTSSDATPNVYNFPAMSIVGDDNIAVGFAFGLHGGKVRYSHFNAAWFAFDGSTLVNDGSWHQVVVTHDFVSGAIRFYVDGHPDGTANLVWGYNVTPREIGAGFGFGYKFVGALDEVAIYQSVLSAGQVLAHYRAARPVCLSTTTFANNAWNFISGIFDGVHAKFFVNGRQECDVGSVGTFQPAATAVAAGATAVGTNAWSGAMADLKIYSSGTAADVATNFAATANRFRSVALKTEPIVTSGLALNFDAAYANGVDFPGAGCGTLKWFDRTSSSNDGTLTNFAGCGASSGWNGTGAIGNPYKLSFDGVNDYVDVPATIGIPNGGTARTLEAWVNERAATNGGAVISIGNGAAGTAHFVFEPVNVAGTDYIFSDAVNGANNIVVTGGEVIPKSQWTLIDMTMDTANNWKYYINGVLTKAATFPVPIQTGGSAVRIGQRTDPTLYNWPGDIAKAAVYNRTLSAAEVRTNFNATANRFRNPTPETVVTANMILNLDAQYANGITMHAVGCPPTPSKWFDLSSLFNDAAPSGFAGCGATNGWNGTGVPADPYRLELSSTGGYYDLNMPTINTAFGTKVTVEMWLYWKNNNSQMPFGFNLYDLDFVSNGIGFNTTNGDLWGTSSVGLQNQWLHLVAEFDNGTPTNNKLWINGTPMPMSQIAGVPISRTATAAARISSFATNTSYRFDGSVAKLAVYNGSLTQAQITSNCNALGGRFTGVVCH